jgi:hypothetical protein
MGIRRPDIVPDSFVLLLSVVWLFLVSFIELTTCPLIGTLLINRLTVTTTITIAGVRLVILADVYHY